MDTIINIIVNALVWMINMSNAICHNYWIAILLFTLLTKVILLPLSIWVQKNSIKTVKMQPEINHIKATYIGNQDAISEEQYKIFKKYGYNPFADLIPLFVQLALLMGVVEAVKRGTPLTDIPAHTGGMTYIVPLLAALSAFFMCYVQNKINVLQVEQGVINRYGTMIFSVMLSLYLGFFVSVGVGIYWTYSNVLSVLLMVFLNIIINPKKHIDYAALEASKKELKDAQAYITVKKAESRKSPYRAREKQDYKKFLGGPRKKLVFYSEKNGFYKYYQNVIEEIIRKTNIVVHYITSDPNDEVFTLQSEQLVPYYIGENKLIVLMMKLEADIVVMTMPDLQKYHIKRSLIKNDIEYIYLDHGIGSMNMMLRKHAVDAFDTIFASNELIKQEIRAQEEVYQLKKKNIVEFGSALIDNMIEAYQKDRKDENKEETILIAPSWQEGNILDSCVDGLLETLLATGRHVIVRPHPQYVRHFEAKLLLLSEKYSRWENFELQMDFSSNSTVFEADILITDWSGIAYEYAFCTLKPVLFINTPMKVMNPDYQDISIIPFDIQIRDIIGISISPEQVDKADREVERLLTENTFSKEQMAKVREKYLYHVNHAGEVGADYIINQMINYSRN